MSRTRRWVMRIALVLVSFGGLVLVVPMGSPAAFADVTGTVTCVSTISGVTYTVNASLGGSIVLGGYEPDSLTGGCTLSGGNPQSGTITTTGGASLVGASGFENDGTIDLTGDDLSFTDSGAFYNVGTILDESPGFSQSLAMGDLVNTGTVAAVEPSGATSGPALTLADGTSGSSANEFDNEGIVTAGTSASIAVDDGTFVLESNGTVTAGPGTFGIGAGGTFQVNGGTVTGGNVQEDLFLGTCIQAVAFSAGIPSTSTGTIEGSCSYALSGTIPTGWSVDIGGGTIDAAPGAANDGTVAIDGDNVTFTDSGAFTNAGILEDSSQGFSQSFDVADMVNTGTVMAAAPSGSSSGPDVVLADGTGELFENEGSLTAGNLSKVQVSDGTFQMDPGSTLTAGPGVFGLGTDGSLTVNGGTVTGGSIQTFSFLGTCATGISFGSSVPVGSTGTIDNVCPITLAGTVPTGWDLTSSGAITAAPGAGNAGTLDMTGNVTLGDSGLFTNEGQFEVSDAFVTVQASPFTCSGPGEVDVTGALTFSSAPSNLEAGTLTGCTWTAGGRISLGQPVTTLAADVSEVGPSGYLQDGQNHALASLTTIDPIGQLSELSGEDLQLNGSLVNEGTIDLDSPSYLAVGGSFTQSDGATLGTTLDGTNPGTNFGQLRVTGQANLGGILDVTLATGYQPGLSDTQAVVTGSPVSGTFEALTGQTANPNGTISVSYTPGAATLSLVALSLSASSSTTGYGKAGDIVQFSYGLTNETESTLSNIALSDTIPATGGMVATTCPHGSLSAGQEETCTGAYSVTQADVDAGSLTDSPGATATNPQEVTINASATAVTVSASSATSSMSLVTTSTTPSYGAVGDAVGFDYKVTNTGTTTLSNISVSDAIPATGGTVTTACPPGSLSPGQSETCTGSYTVTQADLSRGSVIDSATAVAESPQELPISSSRSSATVQEVTITSVSFMKSSSNPEVVVVGSGFGTEPGTVPACTAKNTDFANSDLWIEDNSTGTSAGQPGDCIGLKITSYTTSSVVFTFGSAYLNYPALASGDQYTVHVMGSSYSGTVTYNVPAVTTVHPSSGPGAGGTKVTISGDALNGAMSVMFGEDPATSFTPSASGKSITAYAPAEQAGTVNITVTTPNGTTAVVAGDEYTYLAPSVTALRPATGPPTGGTKVTIKGTALNGATSVLFGEVPATSFTVSKSGKSITAYAPAEHAGTVKVTVTTPAGTSAAVLYTYT